MTFYKIRCPKCGQNRKMEVRVNSLVNVYRRCFYCNHNIPVWSKKEGMKNIVREI